MSVRKENLDLVERSMIGSYIWLLLLRWQLQPSWRSQGHRWKWALGPVSFLCVYGGLLPCETPFFTCVWNMSSFLTEQIFVAQLRAVFVVCTATGQYLGWYDIACDMEGLSSNHGSAKQRLH